MSVGAADRSAHDRVAVVSVSDVASRFHPIGGTPGSPRMSVAHHSVAPAVRDRHSGCTKCSDTPPGDGGGNGASARNPSKLSVAPAETRAVAVERERPDWRIKGTDHD
ncbi:MAG: hypothetical protein COZ06_20620 [Armatimonadetes bacterium CG_4_10_14_3_um_filter_66_18]|nr:hypothetical protein [Armatimonadota bacterium]OIP04474.1 MAG: hypothetical protein AUJ96_12685 [Armatimonadetes bacterium CG2_30_66_41]PIU95584.1 MAG: hypothetical protein COS65_01760 [Armatimonadetes bacterium CG06_land_8_20_14_3_00_66_21]PIX47303.1 MAG: hypothetical protein COZ57_08825 [Armatimonadetes bacterium CG_4_8_14_3_um_filter_66_20]PIY44447.1 MAG: hypothetical protein COZ06_20620 [Armatimonadetes bacterium CG_4_10_14_3_um_filter_66_18]PIZ45689.1 MAG: hypothetical protein COY42_11